MFSLPLAGLFLHVGYSVNDRYLLEDNTILKFNYGQITEKLSALLNGDAAEQVSTCGFNHSRVSLFCNGDCDVKEFPFLFLRVWLPFTLTLFHRQMTNLAKYNQLMWFKIMHEAIFQFCYHQQEAEKGTYKQIIMELLVLHFGWPPF